MHFQYGVCCMCSNIGRNFRCIIVCVCVFCHQQMRRTGNKDENKRILMDLDVVLKSHDCPYIIQCYGAIVTNVGVPETHYCLYCWQNISLALSARTGKSWMCVCVLAQTDVFIAMELMGTCAEKLKKRIQGPIPERILGKMTVAVSGRNSDTDRKV